MSSIVFIDPRVQDYERLIAGLAPDTQVVILDPNEDGVLQIAEALAGATDLDSVHILSHGSSGTLYLGSTILTEDNLGDYEAELAQIGDALSEDGDILLYGCSVAAGEMGLSFIASLADSTGADVAASTDLTGSGKSGGDWTLEAATGTIDSDVVVTSVAQESYTHTLATYTGGNAGEVFNGTAGNDTFTGAGGDDTLNGAGGIDTVTYSGPSSGYNFRLVSGNIVITDVNPANGSDGADTLTGIERFAFADGTIGMGAIGEFRVNTATASHQVNSDIAVLPGGGYVVTWESAAQDGSGHGVYAQRYAASGLAAGTEFRVNTVTANHQYDAAVAALSDGALMVAWTSDNQDGDLSGIYAQRYGANGAPAGAAFRVNTTTADHQLEPAIAALSGGGCVVTWMSLGQDGSDFGVYAQRYDAGGAAAGSQFRVNTTTAGFQGGACIAALADGGFMVVWESDATPGFHAQRYAANGATVGGQFVVGPTTAGFRYEADVAALAGGGFVAVWTFENDSGTQLEIYAQRYGADGNAGGAAFRVNSTTADYQSYPSVAALSDGGFVVAWVSDNQDGSFGGIYAQRYDASGAAVGGEFRINATTAGDQFAPAVAGLPDGGFVVTWEADGQDGGGYGVYARHFDASGNTVSLRLTGDAANNAIVWSGAGDIVLDGGAGSDTLTGGTGNDTYLYDGFDTITEAAGAGTDLVRSSVTYTLPANVEHLALLGAGAIHGTGNALHNAITGNGAGNRLAGGSGNDTLDGGAGVATLIGGAGNDTFVVNSAGDVVTEGSSGGIDQIRTTVTLPALPANVENLRLLGTGNLDATGSAVANLIDANTGNNVLAGGAGTDTVSYQFGANAGVTVSLAAATAQATGGSGSDTLSGFERLTGSSYGDRLTGSSGNNVLTGLGGNDTLNGSAGNDTLNGGAGDDTYVVNSLGDVVTEASAAGNDQIQTTLTLGPLAANVESLRLLGTGNLDATGNGLANVIYANSGNNVMVGGAGVDTLSYQYGATAGVTVSLAPTSAQPTGGSGMDAFSGFERLAGSGYGDRLTGNAGSNLLSGLGGNDNLIGGAGNDTLRGGAGNDFLRGGDGNDEFSFEGGVAQGRDRMLGEAGADRFAVGLGMNSMTGGVGQDAYVLAVDPAAAGDVVTDFIAGAGGDVIDVEDYFYAKVPLFELSPIGLSEPPALELDVIIFVDPNEYIRFQQAAADTLLQVDRDGVFGETYDWETVLTLQGIEKTAVTTDNLRGVVLEGTPDDDTLVGALGDDTIKGFGGDDILNGLLGADSMEGGDGDDAYYVDDAGDQVVETSNGAAPLPHEPPALAGILDTVIAAINYSLVSLAYVENLTLDGDAAMGTGNALNNVITGNDLANALHGLGGIDTIAGGGGRDTLSGGTGSDILRGGAGNDRLTGGAGADRFDFNTSLNSSANVDRITAFDVDADLIRLDRSIFTASGAANTTLTADAFRKGAGVTTAGDAEDRIIYNTSTGNLYYDADGQGGAAAKLFATLAANLAITNADVFIVA